MAPLDKLPVELIELIFTYGDSQSMIALSESCSLFNEIINNSLSLTSKFTLYLQNYPDNIEAFADTMRRSTSRRRYRNMKISKSRERVNETVRELSPQRFFASVGTTVRHLELNWSNPSSRARENSLVDLVINRRHGRQNLDEFNLDRVQHMQSQIRERARNDSIQELLSILRQFKNLTSMKWVNVHLERHPASRETALTHLSSVRDLKMKHCDAYCFEILMPCNQLRRFEFCDPFWGAIRNPGVESFEIFLANQSDSLKHLTIQNIQYPRLFQADRSDSINFKLNTLTLRNVFFKDSNFAERFFRTQDQLRAIDFQVQNEKVRSLDEVLFYNNILKIIFMNNTSLHTVNIEKNKYKINSYEFLSHIRNTSVQTLNFKVTEEDKDVGLFKSIIRICPNLKNVTFNSGESDDADNCKCFDVGSVLEKTRSLTILNASVKTLINVYAENLQTFEYAPGKTGEYIDDFLGGFLHRHRTIKRLVIGSKNRSNSYFFVSYNLCQLIVDFLHQLESIAIFNFSEVNKSVKVLCTLRNLKILTISAAQYQQFTAKTKVECERMKIKLIPVCVEMPQEMLDYERSL